MSDNRHLVFVYGTLQCGRRNNFLLEGAEFLGQYYTKTPCRLYHNGHFPQLVRDEGGYSVRGELHRVSDAHVRKLNRLEGAPWLYDLGRIHLKGCAEDVCAYIYQQPTDHLEEIPSGIWPPP